MHRADCLIVGGGIIGMLVARELVESGRTVVILERGKVGQESSWAGGGILSPLYPWRYDDAVTVLSHWSQQYYPKLTQELAQTTGLDSQWIQSGLLILHAQSEQTSAQDWARRFRVNIETIDLRQAQALEPELGESSATALWLPQVAQVRTPRLLRSLGQALVQWGVALHENTEVTSLCVAKNKIEGVLTVQGKVSASQIVVAGGAWSAQLLQTVGIPLPIEPVRGQMILFRGPAGLVSPMVLSQDYYVIPRRDGRVLVGSTLERVGFDKTTTTQARDTLVKQATRIIPALAEFEVEHHWAGLRPGSPSGIPFIGQHPEFEGLYVNSGHYRNGVVLAPASARLLADCLLHRTPIVDPAPYGLLDRHQVNEAQLT